MDEKREEKERREEKREIGGKRTVIYRLADNIPGNAQNETNSGALTKSRGSICSFKNPERFRTQFLYRIDASN